MREIKFRGKASLYNIWVYGCYCATKTNIFIIDENGELFPIYKDTVGQYTGLKDKNSVEIYEGDIISYIIELQDGDSIEEDGVIVEFDYEQLFRLRCADYIEVTGNVYESEEEDVKD